jgi:hypothetical protein
LSEGAVVEVCEWVETTLLPSEWSAIADTNEGTIAGISGQPLYPDDTVYSIKQIVNTNDANTIQSLYYYWVKNKALTPKNMADRTKSASEVAVLISNPNSANLPFISIIDKNKFVAHNFQNFILTDTALLNIKLRNSLDNLNPVHSKYQLLTEGVADSLPVEKLENKWIDSLVGSDIRIRIFPQNKNTELAIDLDKLCLLTE